MFSVVRDGDGKIYRSLYGKIYHEQWWALNDNNDNGSIIEVHYFKEYSDTGLRLTASGDHRTWTYGSYSTCALW